MWLLLLYPLAFALFQLVLYFVVLGGSWWRYVLLCTLYAVWIVVLDDPALGSLSQPWFRALPLWRLVRKRWLCVVRTGALCATRNVAQIFLVHPARMLNLGVWLSFALYGDDDRAMRRLDVRIMTWPYLFWLPGVRELLQISGFVPASLRTVELLLARRYNLVAIPGALTELDNVELDFTASKPLMLAAERLGAQCTPVVQVDQCYAVSSFGTRWHKAALRTCGIPLLFYRGVFGPIPDCSDPVRLFFAEPMDSGVPVGRSGAALTGGIISEDRSVAICATFDARVLSLLGEANRGPRVVISSYSSSRPEKRSGDEDNSDGIDSV